MKVIISGEGALKLKKISVLRIFATRYKRKEIGADYLLVSVNVIVSVKSGSQSRSTSR